MKWFIKFICLLVVLGSCVKQEDADISQIYSARTLSNQAIAQHDTTVLANHWTTDYHMITSRNSEVSGRTNALLRFTDEFKARPDVIYVRTPSKIEVFNQWSMASEQGTWTGQWKDTDGDIHISGTYFAKWHKVNGQWLIRAELFVPLKCEGGKFCEQSPI